MSNTNKKQLVQFQCQECPKSFPKSPSLLKHSKVHTMPFSCELCDKKFAVKSGLRLHITSKHTKERPLKCEICGSAFKLNKSLKQHQKFMHSEEISSFQCEMCPKRFKTNGGLTQHKASHSKERQFPCTNCKTTFKWKHHLQIHLRSVHSNDPSFNCKICCKRFDNMTSLSEHLKRHIGEKPHKCQFCKNREFASNSNLQSHINARHTIHLTIYNCDFCTKEYRNKTDLRKHLITVHNQGDNSESWLHCQVCQKSFGTHAILNQHMKSHTIPHKCGICFKGFASNKDLGVHISRVHTKEKTIKCYFCFKSFVQMSNLFTHLQIHTKEQPFKCSVCKKKFSELRNFRRHAKQH